MALDDTEIFIFKEDYYTAQGCEIASQYTNEWWLVNPCYMTQSQSSENSEVAMMYEAHHSAVKKWIWSQPVDGVIAYPDVFKRSKSDEENNVVTLDVDVSLAAITAVGVYKIVIIRYENGWTNVPSNYIYVDSVTWDFTVSAVTDV